VISQARATLNFTQNGSGGTLAVSDDVHTALFGPQGTYTAGNFDMTAGGHGGTRIRFS
jgi:hypothetical protein